MEEPEFKVGDTVIVTTERYGTYQMGAIGVIFENKQHGLPYRVRFTGGTPQPYKTNSYHSNDLERYPKYTEDWI